MPAAWTQADLRVNRQLDLAFLLSARRYEFKTLPRREEACCGGWCEARDSRASSVPSRGHCSPWRSSPDGKTLAAVGEIAGTGGLIFWDLTKPQAQGEIRPAGRPARHRLQPRWENPRHRRYESSRRRYLASLGRRQASADRSSDPSQRWRRLVSGFQPGWENPRQWRRPSRQKWKPADLGRHELAPRRTSDR